MIVDAVCLFFLWQVELPPPWVWESCKLPVVLIFVAGIDPSPFIWAIVALGIVISFTASSAVGMDKGLKWLSDQNLKLYILILLFIIVVGPTAYIFKIGVEGMGEFVTTFFSKSTYLGVATGEDWSRWWSIFYWASWIAYAPVVGSIPYPTLLRPHHTSILAVNLVAPALFGIVWFTVFWRHLHSYAIRWFFRSLVRFGNQWIRKCCICLLINSPLGRL